MKTIKLFILVLVAFALTFANISPSRAQGEAPPADAADIATLTRVVDLWVGSGQSNPEYLITSVGGGLWFAADANNGLGRELWTYTPSLGPFEIDLIPGATSSFPEYLAYLSGAIYFTINGNDGAGHELWKFDWTNGAQRVTDINAGSGDSLPRYTTAYNNELYFQANGNDGAGVELWKYNPVNGAFRVADINPGAGNSYPKHLAVYNGALYFQADNGSGAELWKYTAANGAQLVADVYPGNGGASPSYLAVYDNALYFSAFSADTGTELWMYEEEFGAQQVADINIGILDSFPSYLTAYNGALYFRADGNDSAGPELWKYDPVNGADRVADIYPGATGSFPMYMAVYNGALYFNANNGDGLGYELWKYDTTTTASFRSAKTHDGWVLESSETSNVGGTLNNSATTFNLGDDAQDKQYRSIVSFNTSTLPDNAVIVSATLKIRKQGGAGTNPFTTHGNILVDIRKGPFGTNVLQATDFETAPSRANVGTITNQSVNNWFSAALTKAGHPFINLLGVTQFRLRFATDDNNDNGADFLRFFSADTANMSDYPTLEVKYYIP